MTATECTTHEAHPSDLRSPLRRGVVLLRLLTVPLVIVGLHSVIHFSPWLLLAVGIVAAALLASETVTRPGLRFVRGLNRADRVGDLDRARLLHRDRLLA
jgi:hypothetical protein